MFADSKKRLWRLPYSIGNKNYKCRQILQKKHPIRGNYYYSINGSQITVNELNNTAYHADGKYDTGCLPINEQPWVKVIEIYK